MIFAIATTTLNKEVKRKLKTGQYSREEATFIYLEYLKLKKQREWYESSWDFYGCYLGAAVCSVFTR